MPIISCRLSSGKKGYKWGRHGKCYPTREQAEKQAQAIYAAGYVGDAKPALVSPTGKPIELRAIRSNARLEAQYRKKIKALVAEMNNSILYWLTASYRDFEGNYLAQDASPIAKLQQTMKDLSNRWLKNMREGAKKIATWHANSTLAMTDQQLQSTLKDAGFTVQMQITPSMQAAYDAVVAENVGLITNLGQQQLAQIETLVMQSVQNGRQLSTLTDELKSRFAMTDRRASLIARDQNNKASQTLTRQRQKDLGITQAIWMHSHGGKNPRPSHVKADGKVYDLDKGMYLDNEWVYPSELINCRCFSKPVIPGFIS